MCDVDNISTHVQFMLFCWLIGFVAIYAVLRAIGFVLIYALLCGGKFNQKLHMWRKNYKYQVWGGGGGTCEKVHMGIYGQIIEFPMAILLSESCKSFFWCQSE